MYYRFDFCGGFWDWVSQAHQSGLIFSVKKVRDELVAGNDPCAEWAKSLPKSFFIEDLNDKAVMTAYGSVIQWSNAADFRPHAKAEFARQNVADAFLIAAAKAHNYQIVTQEQSNPLSKRKIYLPDAAAANGVQTLYIYDLLSSHSVSTFLPKPV